MTKTPLALSAASDVRDGGDDIIQTMDVTWLPSLKRMQLRVNGIGKDPYLKHLTIAFASCEAQLSPHHAHEALSHCADRRRILSALVPACAVGRGQIFGHRGHGVQIPRPGGLSVWTPTLTNGDEGLA